MKMKNLTFLTGFGAALVFGAVIISGCTKEGPAGPQGPQGPKGEDGINGTDGTAGCIQCHDNSQVFEAKVIQWEHSKHATGGDFDRNSTSCAPCHTSQGFLERMAAGTMTTSAAIENPNPQNCYTCHKIHSTFTSDDYNFTYTDPVALWFGDATVDFGEGNLCANCHQARIPSPAPVVGSSDTYHISNSHWGPHHSPVANILSGHGGYEVGTGYENSPHSSIVENACVTCHMGEAVGDLAGGHTMNITYEAEGSENFNTAGCAQCHSDNDDLLAKITETQSTIQGLLDQLKTILVNAAILTADGHLNAPLDLTADQLGALLNYNLIMEDKSLGVHNFKYEKTLLTNSIASLSDIAVK